MIEFDKPYFWKIVSYGVTERESTTLYISEIYEKDVIENVLGKLNKNSHLSHVSYARDIRK